MTIREVFDDPRTTTKDPILLAKRARVTVDSAKAFLRKQASVQTMRQHKKPPLSAFAPTGDIYGTWLGDTIYLRDLAGVNAHRGAIFTLLEVNSRYAYCRGIVTKADAKERGVSSGKVAAAMESILTQNTEDVKDGVAPILAVRTDNGPENRGEFDTLLEERKIPLENSEPHTHERLGRIDAFHRTLRRLIGEHLARTNSDNWFDDLDSLVANYNTRPNKGLMPVGKNLAPTDIDPWLEEKLRDGDLRRAKDVKRRTDKLNIVPGKTRVRLLTRRMKASGKDRFRKAHERVWSDDIFVVLSRHGVNSFIVDVPDGEITIWPVHSLQIVDEVESTPSVTGPKIDKDVVRAQRAEFLNIDGEEQAEALAAPAAPKRVSKPTPKMAALLEEKTAEKTAASSRPVREKKAPKRFDD